MIPRRYTSLYPGMMRDMLRFLGNRRLRDENHLLVFEKAVAEYVGVSEAIATATGREGMNLIIEGLGLGEGDEILIPAYTLKELLPLLTAQGLIPKPVDIDPASFNIDPAKISEVVTHNTKALMITHMFGMPPDMNAVVQAVKEHKLYLIEDCAHALGTCFQDRSAGTFGDAGFFSFELTKPVNTFGGGMIVTNNVKMAASIRAKLTDREDPGFKLSKKVLFALLEEGVVRSPFFPLVAYLFYYEWTQKLISALFFAFHGQTRMKQYRYANFQAYLGRRWMHHLDAKIEALNEKTRYLKKEIGDVFATQIEMDRARSTRYFFVGMSKHEASHARRFLLRRGIDVGAYEEITDDCAAELGIDCPNAKRVFSHALQIPMNVRLKAAELDRIAKALHELNDVKLNMNERNDKLSKSLD